MYKLGSLPLGGNAPRVAVSFSDRAGAADIGKAKKAGLDIAELRVDRFGSFAPDHVAKKLSLFKGMPAIGTIRLRQEGGSWKGSESARQKLFDLMIPHVDAIDIEMASGATLDTIGPRVKKHGKLLIVSYHNFETTPGLADLQKRVAAAEAAGADIVKISTQIQPGRPGQIEALASLLMQRRKKNLIVIGMGSEGAITRLLFPRLGSLLTFAFSGEVKTPGQMSYEKMFGMLRLLYPAYNKAKSRIPIT